MRLLNSSKGIRLLIGSIAKRFVVQAFNDGRIRRLFPFASWAILAALYLCRYLSLFHRVIIPYGEIPQKWRFGVLHSTAGGRHHVR